MRNHRILILLASALLFAIPLAAAEIRGRVELVGADGRALPEGRDSVVYFEPAGELSAVELADPAALEGGEETTAPYEIVTVRKDFKPHSLAVPVGSTVSFPNEDTILHNVFSVSGENRFDLGLFRGGESREVTFEHPGVVKIFCNVHHSMAASVLVLETPFFTQPDFGGGFEIAVPVAEGETVAGKLTVWHERAEPWSREITLPLAEPLTVRLTAVRERVRPHRNKFGKPYRTRRGRDY